MVKNKYITTPEQAVEHLAGIANTGKDIAALKILAKEIEMMHHKDKEQHFLYAKLFLGIFISHLQKTGSSVSGLNVVRFLLKKPMEILFEEIKESFDMIKDVNSYKAEGLDVSNQNNTTDNLTPERVESLANEIKKGSISLLEVKKILTEKINITLNDKTNYE